MIINKDIAKAIKKEEEYLYHKVELLDNTANIYEYLAEAGYDDINEFRNDAQEYYLHSQNMTLERVYITEESLNEWVTLSMSNTRLFRSSDIEDPSLDTVAIVGKDFNEHDKFIKEGVHPVVFNYMRGCIITGIEDFNFCLCLPKKNWLNLDKFILNKLKKFISNKNNNVVIDANDILINDKKVVGLAMIDNNEMSCVICHISLTDYNDIIYKLCPPHNEKHPGFINNITKKEFEEEVQSWLQEQ